MKKRTTTNKYHKTEDAKPICPLCGKHTIETEIEDAQYMLDGEKITLKEKFFRCHENPGEQYLTEEMKKFNESQLKGYIWKKEIERRANDKIIPGLKDRNV